MSAILTSVIGILYVTAVLAAAITALTSADTQRRADARKVLSLLLSALPRFWRSHR